MPFGSAPTIVLALVAEEEEGEPWRCEEET